MKKFIMAIVCLMTMVVSANAQKTSKFNYLDYQKTVTTIGDDTYVVIEKPKPTIDGETFDLDGLELNTKSINEQSANISIETKLEDKTSRKAIKALLWWLHFPKRISNVDVQIN